MNRENVARVVRSWLVTISFVLSVGAIVLALALNAQDNARTATQVKRNALSRCHDAREGKGRTLAMLQILADLDEEADGRISPTTIEFQRRVAAQYETLRACELVGRPSTAIYPR